MESLDKTKIRFRSEISTNTTVALPLPALPREEKQMDHSFFVRKNFL